MVEIKSFFDFKVTCINFIRQHITNSWWSWWQGKNFKSDAFHQF